jgi:hypothetical protein
MLEIRQLPMGGRIDDFLNVVDYIYRDDASYVRPLDYELRERLDPRKNPFFEHAEGALFCAYRNGWCVGRVSAQIDRGHLAIHGDATGFFGFLDTIDDPEVARGLLARAESWLRGRGMRVARGPLSLSMTEEVGCQVEGFGEQSYILSPQHRPYQGSLIERAGYQKVKDLYAWSYSVGEPNARVKRAHAEITAMPEVSHRTVSMKTLRQDVELFTDVYNDAWGDNWGYVPATRREVQKMASDLRLVLNPAITCIVSIEGEPAAVALALPNVNEIAGDLGGRLFPSGLPKLVWRLKVQGTRTARLIALGIRKKWRNIRKYAGISAFMYSKMNEGGRRLGMRGGELGWTLEDNGRVNAGIQLMGGKVYKRYRVYEKPLTNGAA